MLDNRKSNKITSTKDVVKMKQSKANDLTAILNGKKINNVTQDVLKSFDDKMTLKDVLAKLDEEKLLANTSNRTSSKSTEVIFSPSAHNNVANTSGFSFIFFSHSSLAATCSSWAHLALA